MSSVGRCNAAVCGVGAEIGHQFNFGPGGAHIQLVETTGRVVVPQSGTYDLVGASLEVIFEPYFFCIVRPCTDPNNNKYQDGASGSAGNTLSILINGQDTLWQMPHDFGLPLNKGTSVVFAAPKGKRLLHRQWLNKGDKLEWAIKSANGAVYSVVPIAGLIELNMA